MKTFLVTWSIDIEAEDEPSAAQKALEIQRDKESTAVVFDVSTVVRIDLQEPA